MKKINKVDQSTVTHFAVLWLITNTITLIGSLIVIFINFNNIWNSFLGVIISFFVGILISDRLAEWKEKHDYKVKGIYNLSDRWAQWLFKDVYQQIKLNINNN